MSRDRFEAMVEKHCHVDSMDNYVLYLEDVLKLHKREHSALVRAVTRLRKQVKIRPVGFERLDGYLMALDDVLALLANRKRRTR